MRNRSMLRDTLKAEAFTGEISNLICAQDRLLGGPQRRRLLLLLLDGLE